MLLGRIHLLKFIILPFIISVVKANENCSNIDLASGTLESARNQTNIGWCYAYSSADLLSYKLGVPVSAVELAYQYNSSAFLRNLSRVFIKKRLSNFLLEGGNVETTLRLALKNGACRESSALSEEPTKDIFFGFDRFSWVIALINQLNSRSRPLMQWPAPDTCDETYKEVHSVFPDLPRDLIFETIEENTKKSLYFRLLKEACAERLFPKVQLEVVSELARKNSDKTAFLAAINEQLEDKNILAISYDVDDFLTEVKKGKDLKKIYGPHSSVVVGRHFNSETHQCEYKVKNSYGKDCSDYIPEVNCKEGFLWIDQERFKKAIFGYNYLKKTETH